LIISKISYLKYAEFILVSAFVYFYTCNIYW
jgi:hypothetical protein